MLSTMRTSKLYSSRGHLPHRITHYKKSADIKPESKCGSVFELLRSDPLGLASDFRGVFSRYATTFRDRTGRCIRKEASSCKGNDWAHCQRSNRRNNETQSAHDEQCQGHGTGLSGMRNPVGKSMALEPSLLTIVKVIDIWPTVKHRPRPLQFLTSGGRPKKGGLRRVMGSFVVDTAIVTLLLDRSAVTPTRCTHPVFHRTINSVVKRS